MANLVAILRWSVFSVVVVFSIIVLGVGSHVLKVILNFNNLKDLDDLDPVFLTITSTGKINCSFAGLAVATAVLTLLSVVAMGVVDHLRKDAITQKPIVEMCWFGFLWVLWLAAGAHTIATANDLGCNIALSLGISNSSCSEIHAIAAFSFLNWLTLMGYTAALLIICVFLAFRRGQTDVWYGSVKEIQLNNRNPASGEQTDVKVAPMSPGPQYPPHP